MLTKGGISFNDALNMPFWFKDKVIKELNAMYKEMRRNLNNGV